MDVHGAAALMAPNTYALDLIAALRRRPAWQSDALCAEPQYPLSLFFPERGATGEQAKAVCARCSVRAECAAFADQHGQQLHGAWGGTNGRDRRAGRNRRAAA